MKKYSVDCTTNTATFQKSTARNFLLPMVAALIVFFIFAGSLHEANA